MKKDSIKIIINKKEYVVNKKKLFVVVSKFVDYDIKTEKELHKVMEKFKLYDKFFIENIDCIELTSDVCSV